jgi:hypothetical protein
MLKAKDLEDLIGQKVTDAKAQKVIAKIPVPGKRKKDDDYYHTYEGYGLQFVEDRSSGRVASIFLYPKAKRFAQYGGELPKKLAWSMSQDDIRALLGDPDQENGPEEDQWHYGRFRLGVKFSKGKIAFFYYSAM